MKNNKKDEGSKEDLKVFSYPNIDFSGENKTDLVKSKPSEFEMNEVHIARHYFCDGSFKIDVSTKKRKVIFV